MFLLLNNIKNVFIKNKLNAAILAQEKEYYYNQCELLKKSLESLRSFKHDIHNHLSIINDYIKQDLSNDALDYISWLIGEINDDIGLSNTGNIAFDSIINYKLRNAKEQNIELHIDVSVPMKLKMEASDIVTILGNMLDNAMVAVLNEQHKQISLEINFNKGRIFIKLENTFHGFVKYEEGQIVSSNKNRGYGLKNIRKSIEKYDGSMKIDHNDCIFCVEILLYVQKL